MKKLLFLIPLIFTSISSASTWYVATNGNDSNVGSLASPFRTIKKGIDTLAANDADGGDTLYIRGGTYYEECNITGTLVGTSSNGINISNYNGETVIMEGGEPITQWTQCTSNEAGVQHAGVLPPNWASFYDQVYKAQIPADSKIYMGGSLGYAAAYGVQLAYGNVRKERAGCDTQHVAAMFPNLEGGDGWDVDSTTTTTIVDAENLTQAQTDYWNGAGVWYISSDGSYGSIRRVTAFTPASDRITFNAAASTISASETYFLDNHSHFFNTSGPGSYVFTPTATGGYYTVYYYKEAGESEANLEANMVYSSKTAAIRFKAAVNYLTINGITFRNYQGRRGTDFFGTSGYDTNYRSSGAIVCSSWTGVSSPITRNVTITNCNMYNFFDYNSCAAVGFAWHEDGFTMENCHVENVGMGGYGVTIYGRDGTPGTPFIFRNNYLKGIYSSNIRPYFFTDIEVSHNEVWNNDGVHGNAMTLYGRPTNTLIAHNIFAHGTNSITMKDMSNMFVFGNVFMANDASATLGLWDTDYYSVTGRFYIIQNSIFTELSTGNQALTFLGQSINPTLSSPAIIRNNILDGFEANTTDWSSSNITDTYNYYMRNSANFPGYPLGSTDVGDYDASGSFTKHIAQFKNFLNDDFRLDSDNGGINQGGDIATYVGVMQSYFPDYNFGVDLQGIPWDSPPSCGAYEYTTSQEPPDTTPPTPNPATWSVTPTEVDSDSITMTATTGTDAESPPVEYYFDEISGNAGATDSGWQAGATYQDDGLTAGLIYQYRVKMRNAILGETSYSTTENGYIEPAVSDTTAPTPDPMTWATVPTTIDHQSITMEASEATDATTGPVQYFFTCTTNAAFNSSWQTERIYTVTGLTAETEYTFTVKARDSVYPTPNETAASATGSDTTDAAPTGGARFFIGSSGS